MLFCFPISLLRFRFSRTESKPCTLRNDTLERIYNSQLALEAAIMELMLVEQQGHAEACKNVRSALQAIGENEG